MQSTRNAPMKQDEPIPASPDKVTIEVGIMELFELIDFNRKMYEGIPKDRYEQMTMAGHTLGVTAKKYSDRAEKLDRLLNETWPK